MPRKPNVATETIISLVEQFYLEKCNGNPFQLKIPKIGEYIRSQGYYIQDYTIRRNETVMDHIKKMQEEEEQFQIKTVSVFRDTDIDSFLALNNTKEKLKTAIREKDNYYKSISISATHCFDENRRLQEQVQQLQKKIIELEAIVVDAQTNASNLNAEFRTCKTENQKLREIIDKYVYPEIANELLKKQGLLQTTANIINKDIVEQEIVASTDNITPLKNKVIKDLFQTI